MRGSRFSFFFLITGLLAILVNHFFLDWSDINKRKVVGHFDELLVRQQDDLDTWLKGNETVSDFQKRVYIKGDLIRWSDDGYWPAFEVDDLTERSLLADESGTYLVCRSSLVDSSMALSLYPLERTYEIANKHIRSRLNVSLPKSLISLAREEGVFLYRDLFYFDVSVVPSRWIDAAGFLLVCLGVFVWMWKMGRQGLYLAFAGVFLLRFFSLYLDWSQVLVRFSLFDPLYYTSSFWNPTLGDLLLNCLLIFIAITAWSQRLTNNGSGERKDHHVYLYCVLGSVLTISIFSTSWSILDNSQILLDVGYSISFDLLRIVAFLCLFLIAASQFFVLIHVTSVMSKVENPQRVYLILAAASIVLVVFSVIAAVLALVYLLVVYLLGRLKVGKSLGELRYENLLFVSFAGIFMAAVLTSSLILFHYESELDSKKKFVNHLLIKQDVLVEQYLYEMLSESRNMEKDHAITWVSDFLKQAVFDKYEWKVMDSGADTSDYKTLKSELAIARPTDHEGIYFIDDGHELRYLCVGHEFYVNLRLKNLRSRAIIPSLLVDDRYVNSTTDFDYAIFKNEKLLFHHSKFGRTVWPTHEDFELDELYEKGVLRGGKHYFGTRASDGRVILVISKAYSLRLVITNFFFLFLVIILFISGTFLIRKRPFFNQKPNFTRKIQLYLILVFVAPFMIAGIALLNSLNSSYKEEIQRNYLKKSLHISSLLASELTDSSGKIDDTFQQHLTGLRDVIQADVIIYDIRGRLVSASQPAFFDLKLQGNVINPVVFADLLEKGNRSVISEAKTGNLGYKVTYTTILNREGNVAGFMSMPFPGSKNHLKREQLEVFGSLVIIFGAIFLVAIVFGNFVLNSLLGPLRMVARKIRNTTLQEENKPILYESSDEIGSLVRDYNHMLVKLEKSKLALARTQKEAAWKEIVRQVAHEIKNPLTPMQLKIQQMLRKEEQKSSNYHALTALLEQVDTLGQIAESFSLFAEMPAPNPVNFDLSSLLEHVVNLYQSEDVEIRTDIQKSVFVEADRDLFQRILNNIVLNAIQSVDKGKALIEVRLSALTDKCEICVRDNGSGISPDVKDKVFLKYFSTKREGSGIGLALSKKGVEHAGGNIWFESAEDKGTAFYITMPMVVAG